MSTIFGLFAEAGGAQRAIQALRRAGFDPEDLHVITPEPYHEYKFTAEPDERKTSRYALVGGIIGGVSGAALAAWTAASVQLPTGGMPIIALAPVGIIAFALAGLGAVAGAIFKTMQAAGLPDFKGVLYDADIFRELATGGFLLAVLCSRTDRIHQVRQLLLDAGANPVK